MKKFGILLLVFCILMTARTFPVCAESNLELIINGEVQTYSAELISVRLGTGNNRILAPARELLERLGAEVTDEGTGCISAIKGDTSVEFAADSKTAVKNGKAVSLEVAPRVVGNVLYAPAEFCGNVFDYHVIRERAGNRVRMISKTDITAPSVSQELKPGTAELVSEVHRPVPTSFARSGRLDDLIYRREDWSGVLKPSGARGALPQGETVFTQADFNAEITRDDSWLSVWRYANTVSVKPQNDARMTVCMSGNSIGEGSGVIAPLPFSDALRIGIRIESYYDQDKVINFNKKLPAAEKDDKFVLSFYARLISGGDPDYETGKLRIGIAGNFDETVEFGKEWKRFDILITGLEGEKNLRIYTAIYKQVMEIGGFTVQNIGKDADVSYFDKETKTDLLPAELKPGAAWRKDALARIEQVRKGDFTVEVKDRDGKAVQGAEVKLDMFEHEFKFGVTMDTEYINDAPANKPNQPQKLLSKVGANFNSMSVGNGLKWEAYADDPSRAKTVIAAAKEQGIKYVRGHALWMPLNSYKASPQKVYDLLQGSGSDKEARYSQLKEYIREHFAEMNDEFPYIYEWDVTNEINGRTMFTDAFGKRIIGDVYKIAEETLTNGQKFALCDNAQFKSSIFYTQYWDWLDRLKNQDVRIDMIAMQGHMALGSADPENIVRPTELLKTWDRFAYEYQKTFAITEFSLGAFNDEYGWDGQSDAMRDILIAAYSHPACTGFNIWWMSDCWLDWTSPFRPYNKAQNGDNGGGVSPLFGEEVEAKPGLEVYQDLLYNKWWTKGATAVTDENGRGTVRGFYGDYDISVTVGGKEVKTAMAAFHKGYENVLTLTID